MIRVRPSNERGHFDHGWLDTYHSFSFGDYDDPAHMGFRALRVLNEDVIAPATGFPRHGHRDMEILTYVVSGELTHGDSLGHSGPIPAGEVQRMTAGTGILHSEANRSPGEPVHLFQVWILPDRPGHTPGYEQRALAPPAHRNAWGLVASGDGREGSMTVHQEVEVRLARLDPGAEASHALAPGRHAWVQVARGELTLNGVPLRAGDGAAVSDEAALSALAGAGGAEALLFDLA